MRRQPRGPQHGTTVEAQALPSDSCVDVQSQNISLDCVYLLGTGGLGFLPSPACMLNALKIQFWLSQVFLLARDGEGQA